MRRSRYRSPLRVIASVVLAALAAAPAAADEIWVAPTAQQDLGGLTIGSNTLWPVTALGGVRMAWAVPDDLQTFQAAKLVVLPHAPGGAATLNVFVCSAEHADLVLSSCAGPFTHPFTGVTNRLQEIDISAEIAPQVGIPGQTYLSILAYTTPTAGTDHIVGLRFAYVDAPPANVATLGANTFTGTQTAPAFVGDGSGLTNLPAPSGVASLGANTFTGTQSAPAFVGDGTGVSNVNANLLDGLDSTAFATVGANSFTGAQTINGNLDIVGPNRITRNGSLFIHNFGTTNMFAGVGAGNLALTGAANVGVGFNALTNNAAGSNNTALGLRALEFNSDGINNTGVGSRALFLNTMGQGNAALGVNALEFNTTGSQNTAVGNSSLFDTTTGSRNVAVGMQAGMNATGSDNIYLGQNVVGVAGESNAMYLGKVGTQTKTVVAGVRGSAVIGGEMVVVDADGRLGSASVPAGGIGDITGVAAGAGLAGGGTLGDVSLSLDTAFTNALYAGVVHGHDVAQVIGAATLGNNSFAGTQTIDAGHIDLDPSSATSGMLMKSGTRFLHDFGTENTFLGRDAGNLTMTGAGNTAVGFVALQANTLGGGNTALGSQALSSSTFGEQNTAVGGRSLQLSIGSANVAAGYQALSANTTGAGNTAVGTTALLVNTTGQNNIAVGQGAGSQATTGSNNIFLGGFITGVAGESNAMYLGNVGTQTKTVVAGVRGTGVAGGEMVVVDASGRLGSVPVPVGGGGDITGVAAGTGLTGGGTSGDVSLVLDTAFTNALYAGVAHGHDVSAISGAATLGANTFTATQTINTGHLDLDPSSSTTGVLMKNGVRFLHDFGTGNTFLGRSAGNFTTTGFGMNAGFGTDALASLTTGDSNTAVGYSALVLNTEGNLNTAIGRWALRSNTTGGGNTASGAWAMNLNTSGSSNTVSGYFTMVNNTTGSSNTVIGSGAMTSNTTGAGNTAVGISALLNNNGLNNVAIGRTAGRDATTGAYNIYLGADVHGTAGESNTMYLGKVGTQAKTVIAGVRGTAVAAGEMVVVDADGRLGSAAVPVSGGGDITGVAAGTGLTGGGASGDVGLSIDTAYTDARYAGVVHGHDVSAVTGAARLSGGNLFTGTQTIDAGNLDLDSSSSTAGLITRNGFRFLHGFGTNNTFLGLFSGNFSMTGVRNTGIGELTLTSVTTGFQNTALGVGALTANTTGNDNLASGYQALLNNQTGTANTAVGSSVLHENTSGGSNTASGFQAMYMNTTGAQNVAYGGSALSSNVSGSVNTAVGVGTLQHNTTAFQNTAVGAFALSSNTSGSSNTAIGSQALQGNLIGQTNTALGNRAGETATGNNNIFVGALVDGIAGESNAMYLGRVGTQNKTVIAGVRGVTTVNPDAIAVMIDSAGQLGTISSSRRFKEDIQPMAEMSRRLFDLRPVTFRYTQPFAGGVKPVQYGLIAEEVAQAFPELAVVNAEGQPETVKYQDLSVLLLNEVQRQQETIDRQARELDEERRRVDELERRMERLLERLGSDTRN